MHINKSSKINTQISIFTIFFTSFLLVACGGGSSSGGAGSTSTPPPTTAVTSIVTIGDSIGNGFGVSDPWPPRLANALGVPLRNNSVTDQQTIWGLSVIASELDQNNPSHVVILLGTNDALRGSVASAVSNLQAMVDIATSRNVIAIVGTLPPITRSTTEDARAREISNGIRGLSGATIADVRAAMGDGSTLVDGVHPNNEGQQIIADAFFMAF